MSTLNVRNLPETLQKRLRVRAAESGRSMEGEAREILSDAVLGRRRKIGAAELRSFVDRLYGKAKPKSAVADLIAERRKEAARE